MTIGAPQSCRPAGSDTGHYGPRVEDWEIITRFFHHIPSLRRVTPTCPLIIRIISTLQMGFVLTHYPSIPLMDDLA